MKKNNIPASSLERIVSLIRQGISKLFGIKSVSKNQYNPVMLIVLVAVIGSVVFISNYSATEDKDAPASTASQQADVKQLTELDKLKGVNKYNTLDNVKDILGEPSSYESDHIRGMTYTWERNNYNVEIYFVIQGTAYPLKCVEELTVWSKPNNEGKREIIYYYKADSN